MSPELLIALSVLGGGLALVGLLTGWRMRGAPCPVCGRRMGERQLDGRGFRRWYCQRCAQWMYVE